MGFSVKNNKWKIKLLFTLFLLLGLFIIWQGYSLLKSGSQSKNWPTAEGYIIDSKVSQELHGSKGYKYKPEVFYSYVVEGKNYSSNSITVEQVLYNTPQKPTKVINTYPSSIKVVVYYSPEDPAFAVLNPGIKSGGYIITGIGIAFFLIGTLGISGILLRNSSPYQKL